jgi:hypothetical protein
MLAAQRWGVHRRVTAVGVNLQYEIVVRPADPQR